MLFWLAVDSVVSIDLSPEQFTATYFDLQILSFLSPVILNYIDDPNGEFSYNSLN